MGECLEMPTLEPASVPRVCDKARIKAYPAEEWGGYIWAYMAGEDFPPALPHLEFALVPASHRHVSKKFQECNWAQAAEGGVDTAHFSFLHQPLAQSADELISEERRVGQECVSTCRTRG